MKAPINHIIPNPNNPRLIKDERFKKLVKSIQDFPEMLEIRPIVVNDQMVVLGGNMRLKACKEAGLKEVPIIKASQLTPEQQKEFIIKDNVGFGDWDWETIANQWDAEQVTEWGLDIPDFALKGEAVEDDYEIPDEIITDIVLGDLFEIGEHRLLCGDSTDSDQVAKLMGGQKADMVFTDPPYGMRLDTKTKEIYFKDTKPDKEGKYLSKTSSIGARKTKNHEKVIGDAEEFDFLLAYSVNSEVKEQFWFGADYYCQQLPKDGGWFVWDKTGGNDSLMDAGYGSNFELCWTKQPHKRDLLKITYKGVCGMKPIDGNRDHPNKKPVELCTQILNRWGKECNKIFDGFLGSGTTMVAAHQLNRKCYGIEIDPKYCQVIVDRMLKLDPSIEVKRNGVVYDNSELSAISG